MKARADAAQDNADDQGAYIRNQSLKLPPDFFQKFRNDNDGGRHSADRSEQVGERKQKRALEQEQRGNSQKKEHIDPFRFV
jgi:hypothetical protein